MIFASFNTFINRIRQPQWFALISLLFILPFAAVMYYQIRMLNGHIAFTKKEKIGVEYIQYIIRFLQDIQHDRGMSIAFLSGDASFKGKIEKKWAEIEDDIRAIDSIDEKYGRILKTTLKWKEMKGKWYKVETEEMNMTPDESFDAHSGLANDILSFIIYITRTSNLILDPHLDSDHLMAMMTFGIPPITEGIGKTRAIGARIIAGGDAGEGNKIKLLILMEQIKPAIDTMEGIMQNVFLENPDIEPLMKTYFHDAIFTTNAFINMLNSKIIAAKTIGVRTEEYFDAATDAIDANFRLHDAASAALNELLEARIRGYLRGKYYVIASSAFIAAVFFYIFMRFKGSLTKQISVEESLKTAVKEKEMLLKELHHRVKNNLQIISSLSSLQSEYIKNNPEAVDIFREFQNRIKSMAIVHEKLYRAKNLTKISFSEYIDELTFHVFNSYRAISSSVEMSINSDDISLDADTAIPLGLIINELVSNSIKYAFPDGRKGKIMIDLQSDNNKFTLTVSDNGVGLPEELDFKNTKSLGLQLVNTLAEQIGGIIEVDSKKGTEFRIGF